MNTKVLKKLLVGRPVEQVTDILKLNGWSLVNANEQHMVFSDGFDSLDVYVDNNIVRRVL